MLGFSFRASLLNIDQVHNLAGTTVLMESDVSENRDFFLLRLFTVVNDFNQLDYRVLMLMLISSGATSF